MKRYVFAITGASGPILGLTVLRELVKSSRVHVIFSSSALPILKEETGLDLTGVHAERTLCEFLQSDSLALHDDNDLHAPVSSGSFHTDGMFIVPCSMKTLASVAHGFSQNLIERSADVTIKEGRPLLLAPREMPFSAVHLENMLRLARIGVKIAPPVIAFYQGAQTIEDITAFLAGKLLDAMGVPNDLYRRWTGS